MKRSSIAVVCMGAFLVAGYACALPARADWSTYQGDPAHTAYVPGTYDPAAFAPAFSRQLFTAQHATDSINGLAAGGGRIYIGGNSYVSHWHRLWTVDPATGQIIQQKDFTESYAANAPAYSNGKLYVNLSGSTANPIQPTPQVVSLQAATGQLLWSSPYASQYNTYAAPTVIGNQVISHGGYYSDRLLAINATTGEQQWTHSIPGLQMIHPAADAQNVYLYYSPAGSGDDDPYALHAYNRATGEETFVIDDTGTDEDYSIAFSSPVALNGSGMAFALNAHWITAYDLNNKNIAWKRNLDILYGTNAALAHGKIYTAIGNNLVALDQNTGQTLWSIPVSPSLQLRSDVVLTDSHAFVMDKGNGAFADNLYAIDLNQKKVDWTARVPVSNTDLAGTQLAIDDGRLLALTPDSLHAFELQSSRTIDISSTFDALADFSDGGSNLVEDGNQINLQNYGLANVDRRGLLEFAISGIPDRAKIVSATLNLDIATMTTDGTTFPQLKVYGYAGDGSLKLVDADLNDNWIGNLQITDLGSVTVALDTDYLESLLANSDYLGLLMLGDANGDQIGFVTTEGSMLQLGNAPKLVISYSMVPEPSAVVLSAFAGLGLCLRRRGKDLVVQK